MKLRRTSNRIRGLTLIEVLVVVFVLAVLVAMLLPALANRNHRSPRISCVNNLKQIGLAYILWAGDNGNKYPMQVSVTNGGTMEIFSQGSQFQNLAYLNYLTMPNELSTPRILHCPADTNHLAALNFTNGFSNTSVSYFVGLDADPTRPQMILSGDDNFAISGVPVQSGLLEFATNTPIAWTTARHKSVGNIGLADGSVQQVANAGLQTLIQQTGVATNRLAIP